LVLFAELLPELPVLPLSPSLLLPHAANIRAAAVNVTATGPTRRFI
jgi:hypothetical protein